MYDFLNFAIQTIAALTGVVALVITILINWKSLNKSLQQKKVKKIKRQLMPSRRFFIQAVSALTVGIASWGLMQIKPIKEGIQKTLFYFLPQGKNLIINKNSGVIHHKQLCSDHLPSTHNIGNPAKLSYKARFHGTHKVAILTKVTEGISAEDAIEILLLAVEDNPSSVHIYDKLVKLLGKLKKFESIHMLLENAENNLTKLSKLCVFGSKQYKKYEKAIAHVRLQRGKAKYRARNAAFNN